MVRVGGGWETLPRFLDTLARPDPRLVTDHAKYTEVWKKHRETPVEYKASDGTPINLHTTRADMKLF